MTMKKINAALEYRNTDQIRVIKPDDANSVLLKCFDELINSVKTFHENIVPSTSNYRKKSCLLYTSPSPRDATLSRMPSSA